MDSIETNLKAICRQKGLSLTDVANRMGTTPSNLLSSVKGNPTISKIQDIANALQVSVSELLTMRPESAAGVAIIDGQTYQISKPAANVVQLPVYDNFSEFRSKLKAFVYEAVDCEENAAMMGMLGTYQVFCVFYDARNEFFNVSLCYSNGKTIAILYDKLEYCDWKEDDTDKTVQWNFHALFHELITDIEETVPSQLQKQ